MRRLLRIEVYPNPLNGHYAGDYVVPVWQADNGEIETGTPLYLHQFNDIKRMSPEVRLAALAMVDAEKRFGSILRAFFELNR